ncbi:MAG: hypothetical protein ABIP55_06245, partial [Tepidisphaeraceae bacterium]
MSQETQKSERRTQNEVGRGRGLASFCAPRSSFLVSHRGYSFPEVLFAVAVLGIGFIMIAAIFPAALSQTQATLEETIGTAVTHNGVSYLRGSPRLSAANLPYTNVNLGLPPPLPPPPGAPAPPPNPGAVFGFFDPRIDPAQPPTQAP